MRSCWQTLRCTWGRAVSELEPHVCKFRATVNCAMGKQTRADCYICPALKTELQKIGLLVRQESEARQELRQAEETIKGLRERLQQLEEVLSDGASDRG